MRARDQCALGVLLPSQGQLPQDSEPLKLHEVILVGTRSRQTKVADLPLDLFRMCDRACHPCRGCSKHTSEGRHTRPPALFYTGRSSARSYQRGAALGRRPFFGILAVARCASLPLHVVLPCRCTLCFLAVACGVSLPLHVVLPCRCMWYFLAVACGASLPLHAVLPCRCMCCSSPRRRPLQ